ncbi:hypothetical protein [Streptomyces sp. SP18BB07]|uniref:hypothetical protein n=1 Tax=Streptomyces sp. SP18BB07 TaxID=3002522 RepID=UPI002E78286A|nr:hypothetical protein [Streptomyces sp. SP18BB07]MEE1765280.1 hypothetical protein [Streptomyces sp. SP18BB07]
MGNLADEYGTAVEIYRKALTDTIYAVSPTAAPEQLLALLDRLGLERKEAVTPGPSCIWHQVPGHLDDSQQEQLATRATALLELAGYRVNCSPDVFDEAAYRQAVADIRDRLADARGPRPSSAPAAPATASPGRNR